MAVDTITTQPNSTMLRDELSRIVSALCIRFPDRDRRDVDELVADVYQHLARSARVTSHLIPLTMNRCRRELSAQHHTN